MSHAFGIGDRVTAVTALRNDGTFPEPGIRVGDVLVPGGTTGHVLNIGVYLQEHLIYAVAFGNGRLVGCMEHELRSAGGPGPGGAAPAAGSVSAGSVVSAGSAVSAGEAP